VSAHFGLATPRAAQGALVFLTLVWGGNWMAMKFALENADPVILNVQRTWLAVVVLFGALVVMRAPIAPQATWTAILVTGFFQTTLNFGSTTMALAGGGAGRTSVLVFTMPFWTLVLARLVLHERLRGAQWLAVAFAFAGLALVVAPWDWRGDLAPKLWATASGFGWAAGSVATKYFQRERPVEPVNFIAWQMVVGVLPLSLLPLFVDFEPTRWSLAHAGLLVYIGALSTALGFLLWVALLRRLSATIASMSMFAVPPIALVSSMLVFGERLRPLEWVGIGFIGAGLVTLAAIALRDARAATPVPTPLDGG